MHKILSLACLICPRFEVEQPRGLVPETPLLVLRGQPIAKSQLSRDTCPEPAPVERDIIDGNLGPINVLPTIIVVRNMSHDKWIRPRLLRLLSPWLRLLIVAPVRPDRLCSCGDLTSQASRSAATCGHRPRRVYAPLLAALNQLG